MDGRTDRIVETATQIFLRVTEMAISRKLRYTNEAILDKLQHLVSGVPDPKIIVVHSDHGGGLYLDQESKTNTCLRERFSALSGDLFQRQEHYRRVPSLRKPRKSLSDHFEQDVRYEFRLAAKSQLFRRLERSSGVRNDRSR